jgi:hypothetical protein
MARSIRRPASPRVRLQLHALEERAVPTIFIVSTTSDSGVGSLRAAISAADANTNNLPHTIDMSLVNGTINLASALPDITRDMTITGPGAGSLTVSGYAAGVRVFNQATANLTIGGITMTGRTSASGAAVAQAAANENLTITNSVLTGSSASGRGAVYNLAGGTVMVSGTTVANNTAAGGALWVNQSSAGGAELDILNSQVLNNVSTGPGGAVGSYFGGTLNIDHSTLAGNSTSGGGGALYLWGTPAGTTNISNVTLANNTAAGNGGAILLNAGTNDTTIISSTMTGNVGLTAGAIDNTGTSTVILDNTILSGNTAGGAVELSSAAAVYAFYSAIDTLAGFTFTNSAINLSPANSTPAALHLQPLVNAVGPNGTFGVIGLGAGSTALNTGDPAQGGSGQTDEIGTPRPSGYSVDIGAVQEVSGAPHVLSVEVGDGTAQRSEVQKIVVTFDTAVTFAGGTAAAAFELEHTTFMTYVYNTLINNLQAAVTTNGSGQTVVTLTFTTAGNGYNEIDPASAQNGGQASLGDGKFQLTIVAANVSSNGVRLAGDGATAGTNYVSPTATGPHGFGLIYRLFSDANGDGITDLTDLAAFRSAFNTAAGNPNYVPYLDVNNNGMIGGPPDWDLTEFKSHYNHTV